jgi:leucyl aminopeptidase
VNVLLEAGSAGVPLIVLTARDIEVWAATQTESTRRWLAAMQFGAQPGTWVAVPGADSAVAAILAGVASAEELYAIAHLPMQLPPGDYVLAGPHAHGTGRTLVLGFALGAYQFTRYRAPRRAPARLALPTGLRVAEFEPMLGAVGLVRDLVNTPTEHMGPAELGDAAQELAHTFGAQYRAIVGAELIELNFPAIHAVGRASHRAPRLIELNWGDAAHPLVALVGKGVCFDTGGLDIKPADGMRWMKKDMGGAAHVLALARWIMAARLPVRLRVLVPAVENAIAAESYRPGEVIRTRAGLTVEIDNTDAEGRVVLCDALAYAVEAKPDLILDFATLTGAARIALGPDLPALFGNHDDVVTALLACARAEQDPLWQLPLWAPYRSMLDSSIADMANSGASRHAGSITAALYLQAFVPAQHKWLHVDVYAWNDADRPGRPRGGEAQGLRAAFAFLAQRYGTNTPASA